MECTYFIKGDNTPYTYKELIEIFQRLGITDVSDIVFSKSDTETIQDSIFERLSKLRKEGFVKSNISYADGEPVISDNESISPLEFIDTPSFTYNNKSLITKMNKLDYIDEVVRALTLENVSKEEAEYIARLEVEHWDIIAEDAAQLHTLISDFDFRKSLSDFQELLRGTKFERVAGGLYNSLKAFRENSLGAIKALSRGIPSKIVYNLNLKAELEGLDKTLFGHIDMVVIDGSGDLHLFNYKITTTSILPKSVKLEKYKYLMALLKQILASHGFKVRNATLNIVPIKVKYNEDYSEVNSAISNNNPTELTIKDGKYIFTKYDTVAKHFIKSTIRADQVHSPDLDEATKQLLLIFPKRDIAAEGIRMTAKLWIKKNRKSIINSNNPEYAYEVEFGEGDVVKIKSHTKPENNQELIDEILKRLELLDTSNDIVINRFIKNLKLAITNSSPSFLQDKAYSKTGSYLTTILRKYLPQSKETPSDWELIESDIIEGCGVFLFRHKNGQLDSFILSPQDLEVEINFGSGRSTIVGGLVTDMGLNKAETPELIRYKSTYGNIEAVRAMVLLNLILPKIEGDFTLGKLHVISLHGNGLGIPFNMEALYKECFSNVLKVVNKLPNTSIKNNFTNYKFVDKFEVLLQEYDSVVLDFKVLESEKQELIEVGFGNLASANTIEAKINALRLVEAALRDAFPALNNKDVKNAVKNVDAKVGLLYERVLDAITYFSVEEVSPIERKMSSVDINVNLTSRIPNRNVQIISELYTKTINTIAEKTIKLWEPLRKIFFKFYEDIGYSRVLNSTIGNLSSLFDDLYRKDANGNRLLRLLNPYNDYDVAQIQSHREVKRLFLKKILFEFAKIRYPMNNILFNFTSESDPALLSFIQEHSNTYFNIPLEKASVHTRRLNYSPARKLKYIGEKALEILKSPKLGIEEFVNGINNEEERQLRDEGIKSMQLANNFITGEGNGRDNYIATYGEDYFETNLESLMIDFIERDIQTQEYNKALVTIKGVLFLLELLSGNPNLKTVANQAIETIEKFVNLNIFNASIMEESSLKILSRVKPLMRLVSTTLVAGNVINGMRDTFLGFWENLMRSINHYLTNIDKESLAKAYLTVVKNSFTDSRSINIVNLLCLMYRLSNVDVSRISEGLKSERGIVHYDNLMYSTLRRPDFLNRMTLFVAQCYKDGVYDAFDILDGRLIYDWRKDKRFEVFASGKETDARYVDQMGAYYNAVRAYNLDHPEATIGYNEDLPMPYSFLEVETIKNVAKSIYGSYDKSTRMLFDHIALGTFFGMFSTWMNGIYTNYTMKPGQYYDGSYETAKVKDPSGNYLFFDNNGLIVVQILDKDGNARYFYEGTNQEADAKDITHMLPVMDKVPIVIQGIWYTLKDSVTALVNGNFKEEILLNPMQRKNLDKLFSDLLALLLFTLIFKLALDPAYKDFKKGMKERDVVTNATVELLYKSSSRSYDGFAGIFNVFQFLGENTNPPVYSQNLKLLKETGSMLVGNRSFSDVISGNVAAFKVFQDTRKAYSKSQEQ